MSVRSRLLVLLSPLVLFVLGCEGGGMAVSYHDDPPPPPRYVVVEHGHVCTPACAHYYDGARYVVVQRGHRHGPGCGHHYDGSHWVVMAGGPPPPGHHGPPPKVVEVQKAPATRVHPPPARLVEIPPPPGPVNHYVYDRRGSKWIVVGKGHVHGPRCGHVYVEGHWCIHN